MFVAVSVSAPAFSADAAGENVVFTVPPPPPEPEVYPRAVETWLDAQIALARRSFSCGPIDGVRGVQTDAALRAFQESEGIPVTGELDEATRERLVLESAPFEKIKLTTDELAALQPLAPTWLGKSGQTTLGYETAIELIAERAHASMSFIRKLNPAVNWEALTPGVELTVPQVRRTGARAQAAGLHIRLAERVLQARDMDGRVIAHFPVSIARNVDKRPVGALHITVKVPDPNYTFDPAVFPESDEGRELGRKLILSPGPNNPVGVAWIGLDRPGYGIHGTPLPEQVGRTESHGCFRLANWDARALLDLTVVGMVVMVEP